LRFPFAFPGDFEFNGDLTANMKAVMLRPHVLIDGRPDQLAPTEGTEMYLNTSFSHWYVPIFLVCEKKTSSPLVCHPHNPKTALGVDELL